jgi:hypothetical protein
VLNRLPVFLENLPVSRKNRASALNCGNLFHNWYGWTPNAAAATTSAGSGNVA